MSTQQRSGGVSPAAADLSPSGADSATESGSASSDSESFVLEEATAADVEDVEAAGAAAQNSRGPQEQGVTGDGDEGAGEDSREVNQDLMTLCRRVFQELESGTGFLLTRDLGSALRALGQVPSEHQVEELTSRLEQPELYDRGCTKLTFQEFYQAAHEYNASKSDIKKSVMGAFSVIDKDNSGVIEVNKLLSVLASVGEVLTPADIKELLKELPVDKNGKVDYAKFVEEALGCEVRGATGKPAGGRAKSK